MCCQRLNNFLQAVADEKVPLYLTAAKKLTDAGKGEGVPASAYWVPGRVEVVGKVVSQTLR